MTSLDLQSQALQLPAAERWALVNALLRSLQAEARATVKPQGIAASLIGIAQTEAPPPTDAQVQNMLDERRERKFL